MKDRSKWSDLDLAGAILGYNCSGYTVDSQYSHHRHLLDLTRSLDLTVAISGYIQMFGYTVDKSTPTTVSIRLLKTASDELVNNFREEVKAPVASYYPEWVTRQIMSTHERFVTLILQHPPKGALIIDIAETRRGVLSGITRKRILRSKIW